MSRGDLAAAFRKFLKAGDEARAKDMARLAARCYRDALELDLASRVAVSRLLGVRDQTKDRPFWIEYQRALRRKPAWSQFSCRRAQILVHNLGSVIECADVGPVIELVATADGRFECLPDARFNAMPLAMTMIILRRALWPHGKSTGSTRVRVSYRGHVMWLNARGEWYAA